MMKTKIGSLVATAVLAVGVLGCPSSGNLSKNETGGVYLSIQDFDLLPIQVSVNDVVANADEDPCPQCVSIGELTIASIAVNQVQPTSELMNVEMEVYEVGFNRADLGTRTPNPTERRIFGTVPPNGTIVYEGLPIMTLEEFVNEPLSDLLFENGGYDKETGSEAILLNLELKFFGQTLNGTKVETRVPARFNIQFVP